MNQITITASFNKIGFQMNPSKMDCEKALEEVSDAQIIAMSILAAGYLQPNEAIT
jgi:predicted lactoylglutathione lyase